MRKNRTTTNLSLLALVATGVLTVACGVGGGQNHSFSADQIFTPRDTGRKIVSHCYFAPGKFRAEMKAPSRMGGSLVTIGRQDLGKAWILFPGMKRYREISLERLGADKLYFKPAPDQVLEKLGAETVEGYHCQKMKVRKTADGPNGPVETTLTVWVSRSFPVPLRTLSEHGDLTEYRNIKEGPQPASLFDLPEGYTKMASGLSFAGGR